MSRALSLAAATFLECWGRTIHGLSSKSQPVCHDGHTSVVEESHGSLMKASSSSVDTLIGEGFNFFRIPFLMERLIPNSMSSGTFATEYLSDLTALVTHITDNGAYAAIDPHNYGRYYGDIITSTSDFQAFWTSVAGQFSSNSKVIFDCNNEFHDEPSTTLVEELNQACVDGVRAAGATSQYIFLEGTQWTGAWSWYVP